MELKQKLVDTGFYWIKVSGEWYVAYFSNWLGESKFYVGIFNESLTCHEIQDIDYEQLIHKNDQK